MTINLTFNDLDEMETTILRMAENIEANKIFKTGVPEAPAEKAPAKEEEIPEKTGSNVPEQPTVPPMPEPAKEAPAKIDKVEMRKLLSVLNKSTGENTARKLINGMGFKALTDVPDDRLAELKAKAEEVINAQ